MKQRTVFAVILTLSLAAGLAAQTHGTQAAWDRGLGYRAAQPVEVPALQAVNGEPPGSPTVANPPSKVRFMMLGNSITAATCYQPFVWAHILHDTLDRYMQFVGTSITNHGSGVTCAGIPYYLPTEGHAGWNSGNIRDSIGRWLAYDHPDVVTMHVGTNNFWNDPAITPALITATLKDFSTIIDSIRKDNPAAKILVAQIIPMGNSAKSYEGSKMLDDSIPAWAAARTTPGSPIEVVDMRTGYDTVHWYSDTYHVHPNEAGAQWMADKLYATLTHLNWLGGPQSVNEGTEAPASYSLGQNYPNPFNPSTRISYSLPAAGYVDLKVYDVLGREVASLVNERRAAGRYTAHWDARAMPSGVYFYCLTAGRFIETKKLVVLK